VNVRAGWRLTYHYNGSVRPQDRLCRSDAVDRLSTSK
jgi:hypothetical protein